jgi:tRNA pseudouridine55 synthase
VPVNGILNLSKPEDRTSFSIIGQMRRLSRVRQIGHTGTLDPFASGVLPITFGIACKVNRFISEGDKAYTAVIELGMSTDSYDRDGIVISREDPSTVTRRKLLEALNSFKGPSDQIPPVFSAIKVAGAHSYTIARSGQAVKHKPRAINITALKLLDFNLPLVKISVECSKGTYIRSLANDLGNKLGCGAYVKELVRTRCGVFKLENSVTVDQMEEAFECGDWQKYVQPLDYALTRWEKVTLAESEPRRLLDGLLVSIGRKPAYPGELVRAYNPDGVMVAILKYDEAEGLWRHEKFFQY